MFLGFPGHLALLPAHTQSSDTRSRDPSPISHLEDPETVLSLPWADLVPRPLPLARSHLPPGRLHL